MGWSANPPGRYALLTGSAGPTLRRRALLLRRLLSRTLLLLRGNRRILRRLRLHRYLCLMNALVVVGSRVGDYLRQALLLLRRSSGALLDIGVL
jgi:hypothetical protein